MDFDLVDGWLDGCVGEEGLQVRDCEVGYPYRAGFA